MPFNIYKKITRNINEDGMIVSSSVFLVRSLVGKIDFSRTLRILEIGSGKGAFTKELIRGMSENSTLDVADIKSEYNPWINKLITANPGKTITLYNSCVTELLKDAEKYDVIVSSLPLKNFENADDCNAFLSKVIASFKHSLKPGGLYLQYQYFMSNKGDIERIFGKAMNEVSFVPLNILPAFVYSMTK
jgi:phospholipid N-methyltransferase